MKHDIVYFLFEKKKNSDHYFLYDISPSPQLLLQAWPLRGHYFKSKPRSFLYLAKLCQFYEHVYYCNPNDEGPVCCGKVADAGDAPMSCPSYVLVQVGGNALLKIHRNS